MRKGVIIARKMAAICILTALLSGCGNGTASSPNGTYSIPAFRDAAFQSDQAQTYEHCQADFSGVEDGYISLKSTNAERMKLRISCGDVYYTYDMEGDGVPETFPLNMGSGNYTFQLMEHVGDSKYVCVWDEERSITLNDEFQPFLRPSQLVPYNAESKCVVLAKQLAGKCDTDAEVAAAIYKYLVDHIDYDTEKAATVRSGYLPVPDATLDSGKGICFDYASLAAAMMRSVGIPCKMIFGNVNQDGVDVYHAWNAFYLAEQGWITAEIKATPNSWQRVDITFAAGGASAKNLMNDALYTGQYSY